MRASTSASQARGSTSFSFAVIVSEYMAAARSLPQSEPANNHALRPQSTGAEKSCSRLSGDCTFGGFGWPGCRASGKSADRPPDGIDRLAHSRMRRDDVIGHVAEPIGYRHCVGLSLDQKGRSAWSIPWRHEPSIGICAVTAFDDHGPVCAECRRENGEVQKVLPRKAVFG